MIHRLPRLCVGSGLSQAGVPQCDTTIDAAIYPFGFRVRQWAQGQAATAERGGLQGVPAIEITIPRKNPHLPYGPYSELPPLPLYQTESSNPLIDYHL